MSVTLELQQLDVPPGQRLLIHQLSWPAFERILAELGEDRAMRIAYSQQTLEIRMPLPKHERVKSLLSDIVKLILDELELDCECFGSTTFKREVMACGIEPDDCFYIQNHHCMIGKDRIDLALDPAPDLAIEVDITSKTQMTAYQRLGVPELWIYSAEQLNIYHLQSGLYQPAHQSLAIANLPILELVQATLTASQTVGRSPALRALRQRIRAIQEPTN